MVIDLRVPSCRIPEYQVAGRGCPWRVGQGKRGSLEKVESKIKDKWRQNSKSASSLGPWRKLKGSEYITSNRSHSPKEVISWAYFCIVEVKHDSRKKQNSLEIMTWLKAHTAKS